MFKAEGAVRLPESLRLTPLAAHNKSERSDKLKAFAANSRVECRSDKAFITEPVRSKLGFGNLITFSAAKATTENIKQTNNSCTFLIIAAFKS